MAMTTEHRSKFAALHRQWWRLHMSEKFSSGTKNPKQKNTFIYLLIMKVLRWGFYPFYSMVWPSNGVVDDLSIDV